MTASKPDAAAASANKPATAAKKRGLGRGLDALLGSRGADAAVATAVQDERPRLLPVSQLQPGRFQPRRSIAPEALAELAASIRAQGVIQPILVRAIPNAGAGAAHYEIIAGERRWRASKQVGLAEVPVVVREADDRTVLALALIENIQREDLGPLEEALALQRLIGEFDLTHAQAAEAVGRSRAAVSNLLRLLELPAEIRELLETGGLEMGHARALLSLAPPAAVALARQAAAQGWSVREVESRVQQLAAGQPASVRQRAARQPVAPQADIAALERELSDSLGSRVSLQHGRSGKGRLVIHYHGLDALDGVLARLRGGR